MGKGILSSEIKWQEHEADHSPPPGAAIKNSGAVPLLPHMYYGMALK
jgi:hypothetical protein